MPWPTARPGGTSKRNTEQDGNFHYQGGIQKWLDCQGCHHQGKHSHPNGDEMPVSPGDARAKKPESANAVDQGQKRPVARIEHKLPAQDR